MFKLSSPPTVAKLKTAAYEAAQCEIWPWPDPKPPSAFCIGDKVSMSLDVVRSVDFSKT